MARTYLEPESEDLARCFHAWAEHCASCGATFQQPRGRDCRAYWEGKEYRIELHNSDGLLATFAMVGRRAHLVEAE